MTDEELAEADGRLSVPGVPERVGWPLTVTEQRALVAEVRRLRGELADARYRSVVKERAWETWAKWRERAGRNVP